MIARLRRRHRITLYALGVLLPVIVGVGIAVRTPPAVMETTPGFGAAEISTYPVRLTTGKMLWPQYPDLFVFLRADEESFAHLAVEISVRKPPLKPALLVYWSREPISASSGPGDNAYLLGVLGPSRSLVFPLPGDALHSDGHLALYALVSPEIIASAPFKTASLQKGEGGVP